ncbi:MAG TPA: SRPBCC family protein [Actinomycetota bacterium]
MTLNRYRFRSVWRIPATPEVVLELLHELDAWSRWWPEIRESHRVDEDRAVVRIRSALPYDLHLLLTRRHDTESILEAGIEGDLRGFARFRLRPDGDGSTRLLFEQDVKARKPLMRRLAPIARPLFRWNHARMMRSGRRGLAELVATGTGRSRP